MAALISSKLDIPVESITFFFSFEILFSSKKFVISPDGIFIYSRLNFFKKFKLFKAKKFESSNSSGAGDALFSGFLYAICKGKTFFEAAEFGISLAEKTLEISGPVNPEVSELGKTLR